MYERAKCSPYFKKEVAPKVELIWELFPFDILTCSFCWAPVLNFFALPCCWCIIIPFHVFFAIPWNIAWITLLFIPFSISISIIFGPHILTALFCYPVAVMFGFIPF